MSSATKISQRSSGGADARRFIDLPGPFHMYRGGVLPRVRIAYESWGALAPAKDNVVLLFTGLSPSAHAASSAEDPRPGWWEFMLGAGRPLDTERFHVICVNSLGSCFGSTGPASTNPDTGEPYRLDFPDLSIEDIASSAREALRVLGVRRVHAVVGASLGGMAALAYGVAYPDEVDHVVTISAGVAATPFAVAIRSLQREIITSDPEWRGGYYEAEPVEGMRLARKLGLTSYRSAQEWLERFGRAKVPEDPGTHSRFGPEFQIESYLDWNARKFIGTFDANTYLYLSRAMDLFDLADHGEGSADTALAKMRARRNLVVGVQSDFLFPLWQQEELATRMERAGQTVDFAPLESSQGHDSFLVDKDRFVPTIGRFLEHT